jgi:carboxymethylenebutenolidase
MFVSGETDHDRSIEGPVRASQKKPIPQYEGRMIVTTEYVDIGKIRSLLVQPTHKATRRGVLLYSDIFQLTPPMLRLAQRLAGYGFIVVAPELYGRIEPPGTALDFDRDRQRALDDSDRMRVEDLDADRRVVLDYLSARDDVAGLCVGGWCFGGHLAFRAAFEPDVQATACAYGTGIHDGKLGATKNAGSLERAQEIRGELLLVWGRKDPHIPPEGRAKIHRSLDDAGVRFEARLFDAEHAFMRDEGPRYDPVATDSAFEAMVRLFQ